MAKGKTILLIVIVAIVAVLAGLGGAYFLFGKNSGAAAKEPPPTPTVIAKLGDIVVNLADEDTPRYLRVGVNVEIEGQGESATKVFDEKSVVFKDRVISFLRSKKSTDLIGDNSSDKLKGEMLKVLQDTAAELNKKVQKKADKITIVNVYFSDFIIQ
ncbi:flagellar basal body-associated FliL family protein [Carboxydothermus pertinax]|uniref:Flagellar protein FliL n=1 Tax=Carboxydothermus pertinax TaxID=870242 RepID=A0A1L8CUQ6_9THEO|nr:flagellar basal body-associated FliL family protein [Carboxydothermus pertinax]GAV22569.1 hypothetical protein cpu_10790 [Carboxydothermus pertinax]